MGQGRAPRAIQRKEHLRGVQGGRAPQVRKAGGPPGLRRGQGEGNGDGVEPRAQGGRAH